MRFDVVKKLNEMRLERKLSVYRLAELTGLNQSTLANTFSRGLTPSVANLAAICAAMGVTMSQFFAESERDIKLSDGEIELVENFRRMPEDVRALFCELVKKYDGIN